MYGKAALDIPQSGNIGPSRTDGLSDELAMVLGRCAANTLSDGDGFVTVALESGETKVIGCDVITGEVVIGRLCYTERPLNIGLDEYGRPELWDDEKI